MDYSTENVNLPDEEGYFAIHRAVVSSEAKNADLRKLLGLGADIEALNAKGRTALHLACLYGNHHLVKLLIAEGANVNSVDSEGYTPIFMAVEGSNSSILLLAEAGADIEAVSGKRQTPLMHACEIGKVGAVKNLCELGANANVDQFSDKSLIAMTTSSFKSIFPTNALQMVGSLIKAGAKVDAKDLATGQTELHLVASCTKDRWSADGYYQLMKLLVNAGANPWRGDDKGNSPLSMIEEKGLEVLRPALKKYIRKKEIAIASNIKTIVELKAFFFNQSKLTKREVYELLTPGTPAKQHFHETLALPPITIECQPG